MGLSIDVSALFTEMTMATATADIATKKMLYHYITHHAHHHPVRLEPSPSQLQEERESGECGLWELERERELALWCVALLT
jgi:vesicle coat complex subunit